jgi:serine/threonine protein kinase
MLREESIMMKLNNFETIKKYIPQFYFGFTIIYNENKYRITLMELFKPGRFENIQRILAYISNEQSDIIINATRPLIYTLWRNGVSHNDISTKNILVDISNLNNIKLIDFGLATMFNPPLQSNNSKIEEEYTTYFQNKTKEEQYGSNVTKLFCYTFI